MDSREARFAQKLAEEWRAEGFLSDAALAGLTARHRAVRESPAGESFGSSVLYGLGGILLGCAVLAFMVLLEDQDPSFDMQDVAPFLFLGWGILCAAAAFLVDLKVGKPSLGDAFHVAALLAITAAAFPRADDWPLWGLSAAYALAILAYRRTRVMVPLLALAAFNVAFAAFAFGFLEPRWTDDGVTALWFGFAAIQLVAILAVGRHHHPVWVGTSSALAVWLLAGTFLAHYFSGFEQHAPEFRGDIEVYVALLMGIVLATGLWLAKKGMVVASALVIAIDAIVFAFDVGEIAGGLIALLAVAALLIWQAGSLRTYLRE